MVLTIYRYSKRSLGDTDSKNIWVLGSNLQTEGATERHTEYRDCNFIYIYIYTYIHVSNDE